MRLRLRLTTFLISILLSLTCLAAISRSVGADPYGESTYGSGRYNCNNAATCEESLTNTGDRNSLYIGIGAVILSGIALWAVLHGRKRGKKPPSSTIDQ